MCGGALWFWCMYKCMVWLGHYQVPFSSSCHSRSLTAPTAQMPLWKLCCIFLFVREIFTKIPLIVRQVQTVLWRKSKFVCRGNPSAWSAGGCWIIAGGWFQSQHWTPNFHYQFVPNNTILSCCMLIIHFSVAPISLHYTSIIQIQRAHNSKEYIVAICIFSKAGQCNVWGNLSGRFSMTRYRVLARPTTQLYLKLVFPPNSTVYSKT